MTADAIVVAGGSSRRMAGVDKLAAPVAGRPLLAWSLAALAAAPEVDRLIVVVPADRLAELSGADWLPSSVAAIVPGGPRRQDSVAAGFDALLKLDPEGLELDRRPLLVHDGARPLVTPELVSAVVRATIDHGAAVPVVAVAETLKRVVGEQLAGTVERAGLFAAQTPQGMQRALLRRAYGERPPGSADEFTDEAALLEACRIPVHAIPGDPVNLKVTVPADLERVSAALAGARRVRVGSGSDRHAFGPGSPLRLAGVEIAGAPRLHGHSDGDVVLHAVADALLGAAALGDLGRLFPADARTPPGVDSRTLIREVVRRLAEVGWRPASVDVTIGAGRPRLGDHLDSMRDALAGLLEVRPGEVGLKASSGNLAGPDGAGRTISALAVATIEPLDGSARGDR